MIYRNSLYRNIGFLKVCRVKTKINENSQEKSMFMLDTKTFFAIRSVHLPWDESDGLGAITSALHLWLLQGHISASKNTQVGLHT